MIFYRHISKSCQRWRLALLGLTLFGSLSALGQQEAFLSTDLPEATEAYSQGNKALSQGAFFIALQYYQQAYDLGMDDSNMHYNLGACYYNLHRLAEAQAAFQLAALNPDPNKASLASYNLAMLAVQNGHPDDTEYWAELARQQGDYKVRDAIEELLHEAKTQNWTGVAMINRGNDNNVTLTTDSQSLNSTGLADDYTELLASASRDVGFDGWAVELTAYTSRYATLNDYDIGLLSVDSSKKTQKGGWDLRTGASTASLFVAGKGFNQTFQGYIKGSRSIDRQSRLHISYDLSHIQDLNNSYRHLNGWRHRLKLRSSWESQTLSLQFDYQLELNDRADSQTTVFSSYSPTRHLYQGTVTLPLGETTTLAATLGYRRSEYNDANTFLVGAPLTREDDRDDNKLVLTQHFSNDWQLSAEYNHSNNSSNFSAYRYKRTQLSVGLVVPW